MVGLALAIRASPNAVGEEATPPEFAFFKAPVCAPGLQSTYMCAVLFGDRRSPISPSLFGKNIQRRMLEFARNAKRVAYLWSGGDSADAGIEYISPEEALISQQYRLLESKNEVAKAINLASRCSVSALVSALVTNCVRNPVVVGCSEFRPSLLSILSLSPSRIAEARRKRQHILITTPLRRRWPTIVADARRWDHPVLQFLQRAPARLRQNESTSHGLRPDFFLQWQSGIPHASHSDI
jgi:hypothetical protein